MDAAVAYFDGLTSLMLHVCVCVRVEFFFTTVTGARLHLRRHTSRIFYILNLVEIVELEGYKFPYAIIPDLKQSFPLL